MADITWISESNDRGVRERRYDLMVDDHVVPSLIWTPEGSTGPRPVVLIGHGGGNHKRVAYVLSLARRLVRHQGWAAVCIDAPGHGERADATGVGISGLSPEDASERMRSATSDWVATLDAVQAMDDVGDGPVGWWGLSMGTGLGVPFVAREPRIQVAVFGLMALVGDPPERFAELAGRITVPILYLLQLEDELFTREGCLALFDAFASTDKRLHANPGAHSAVPVEEIEASEAFLARHLVPAGVSV